MRIGILLGPNACGGMERQANLLSRGLLDRGFSVRVIFNSRPSSKRLGLDWMSVPHQYLWSYNPIKKVSQHYLAWLLRWHKIDLLHVFFWGNMEFAVGSMNWARNVAFIGSQRDTDFVIHEDIKKRLKQTCLSYDYVTCNSQETCDLMSLLDICPSNKVKVIYNGILVPESFRFRDPSMNPRRVRTVLFPNRLFPYKNPILFIDACAEVSKTIENLKIIVCGWGDLEETMKERCRELGIMDRCAFLGALLPEAIPYSEADLVVNCSSSREGMSNSLMEALANGVPVVATNATGSSELLKGHTFGRLIPIDDKDALVRAMCDLLSVSPDTRAALGKDARKYMAHNFSVDRFVNEHVAFYNEVLFDHRNRILR